MIDTTTEFFLSHHHLDKLLAGDIRKLLETKGFAAFVAHEDITPSDEWEEAIRTHLHSCTALIAVVTENFANSSFTNQEVGIALEAGKPVIPIAFGVSGGNLPGFLKSKQAVFCENKPLARCVNEAVEPFSSEQLPESVVSRISIGLVIFAFLYLVGLSWAIVWIFTGVEFSPTGTLIGLVIGAAIAFEKGIKGSWDTMRAVCWVRPRIPQLLIGALCLIPAAFGLRLSLTWYPMLSGIDFESYLTRAPVVAVETFILLVIGAFFFNHPTNSLREMRLGVLSSIRHYGKSWKVYAFATILLALCVSTGPIDSHVVLFTPKVGFVETRYLTDGQYHIYQIGMASFGAWSENEKIVHIIAPLFPLITESSYSFRTNSTTRSPSIISQSGLTVSAPSEDSQGVVLVGLSTDSTSTTGAQFTVQFYSEFDVSSVAYIYFSPRIFIRNFDNGTQQLEQKFTIVSRTPYELYLYNIMLYQGGYAPENVSITFWPQTYSWPRYYYNNYTQTYYLDQTVQPYGNLTADVIYNSP